MRKKPVKVENHKAHPKKGHSTKMNTRLLKEKGLIKARFSKTHLLIFAGLFAAIGGYFLLRSFAAEPLLANVWVDTNGGTCTRSATPVAYNDAAACGTLQAAADKVVNNSCDVVAVRDGTYKVTADDQGYVSISKSGQNAGCTITFKSENKWGAKLDGWVQGAWTPTPSDYSNAARSAFAMGTGARYVRVEGFDIFNINDGGLRDDDGDGIYEHSENRLPGAASVIDLYNGGDDTQIVGNHIHNIGQTCTNTYNGNVAIFTRKSGVIVEGNVIHDIGRYDAGQGGCPTNLGNNHSLDHGMYINDRAANHLIKNNVFYNTYGGWALQFYSGGSGSSADGSFDFKVYNNTFMNCSILSKDYTCFTMDAYLTNASIRNNVFYHPDRANFETLHVGSHFGQSGLVVSDNITNGTRMTDAGTYATGNRLNTDPMLVSPPTDARLRSGSPAIDTGVALAEVTIDHDGNPRPAGSAYDVGAFEFGSGPTPPTVSLSASPTSVASGSSSTLTWSSGNATSCSASGAWSGSKALSGSESTGPLTATATYSLTCTGTSGSAASSVTVTVSAPPPQGAYYVSPSGSDNNNGSASAPFQTIQKAADVVDPGNVVIVRDGTYTDTNNDGSVVKLTRSGSAGNLITFRSENKWGAKIQGTNDTSTSKNSYGFDFGSGVNYIRIENFDIYGFGSNWNNGTDTGAAEAYASASGIVMRLGGDNSQITGNKIHNIGNFCNHTTRAQTGVYLEKTNIILEKNVIYDIGRTNDNNSAWQPDPTCDYQAPPYNRASTFKQYITSDNGIYMTLKAAGDDNITIKNNLFYNLVHGAGIYTYNDEARKLRILNNTFSGGNPFCYQFHISTTSNLVDFEITNNVFHNATAGASAFWAFDDEVITGSKVSNNVSHGTVLLGALSYNGSTVPVCGSGAISTEGDMDGQGVIRSNNLVNTDPKLVNPTAPLADGFKLQTTSPALGMALDLRTSSGVTDDYEGITRPQGSGFDAGAYESTSGGSCPNGDVNGDCHVTINDLSVLLSNWSSTTNAVCDLNSNGVVDIFDLSILLSNYGN